MTNNSEVDKTVYGLVPFFYDKNKEDVGAHIEYLKITVEGLKKAGINNIIVVNDGSEIDLNKLNLDCELIINKKNEGKTGAVLTGLKYISAKDTNGYIIQCDYDADQNSEDAKLILDEFKKDISGRLGLVIGDRYTEAQPDPFEYRKVMLYLQQIISKQLGYNLQDTVSGLRGYTTDFGNKFLSESKSKGFGNDTEQLVVAYLEGMNVLSIPLTYSRRRTSSTPNEKLIEVMNAVLAHKEKLRERKIDSVVNILELIKENLEKKEINFEIDLRELGENKKINFIKKENGMYTADFKENLAENNELKFK